MKYHTVIKKISDIPCWNQFIKNGFGGTMFHEDWYLNNKGVSHAICVYHDHELHCVMPLYGYPERCLNQSTIFVPYCGPITKLKNDCRANQFKIRLITVCMINYLQDYFNKIVFSVPVEIKDIVTYIQSGFIPEVRYTYLCDLTRTENEILKASSTNRQRDYIKSINENLQIQVSEDISNGEKLLFWSEEDQINNCLDTMKIIIKEKRGVFLQAYNDLHGLIGQLFLAWDHNKSYTLYSYYNSNSKNLGVSTRLYFEAMFYSKHKLGLKQMDFEGSVLKGVEAFYQTFGAAQKTFYNLYWFRDEASSRIKDIYKYE